MPATYVRFISYTGTAGSSTVDLTQIFNQKTVKDTGARFPSTRPLAGGGAALLYPDYRVPRPQVAWDLTGVLRQNATSASLEAQSVAFDDVAGTAGRLYRRWWTTGREEWTSVVLERVSTDLTYSNGPNLAPVTLSWTQYSEAWYGLLHEPAWTWGTIANGGSGFNWGEGHAYGGLPISIVGGPTADTSVSFTNSGTAPQGARAVTMQATLTGGGAHVDSLTVWGGGANAGFNWTYTPTPGAWVAGGTFAVDGGADSFALNGLNVYGQIAINYSGQQVATYFYFQPGPNVLHLAWTGAGTLTVNWAFAEPGS
jgi:hypothetical protein